MTAPGPGREPMWRRYLRFWRPDVRADVDEELRFHLDMRERELVEQGVDAAEARARALERFGPVAPVRGACEAIGHEQERRARRGAAAGALARDLALAVRALRRRGALAAVAVVVLAVGIGASTAMFGVVRGVLLRPLPVREQDRLVVLWTEQRARSFGHLPVRYAAVGEFRARSRAFAGVAAVDYNGAFPQVLRRGDDVLRARGTWVSGGFFDVLGVRPALGRLLRADDDARGAAPVVVIGERLWRREFGGDPRVIGRTLRWRDRAWTVVGVAAPGFSYPAGAEFWAAIQAVYPEALVAGSQHASYAHVDLVGRLRDGATVAHARADLDAFVRDRPDALPTSDRDARAVARPLADLVVGDVRPALWSLSAATALVLLIACANVATLLLIAGAGRARELAVRTAIGAGRGRLVRQLLTESGVLALAGAAAGAAVAAAAVRALVAAAPPELPRLDEVRVDGAVLAFATACAALVTVAAGLAPALLLTQRALEPVLRASAAGAAAQGWTRVARHGLVAAQLALALVVLAGAGLLGRTLLRLQRVDTGLATDRLVVAQLELPTALWDDRDRFHAATDRVLARARAIPGVLSATLVNVAPFSGPGGWDAPYAADGQTADEAAGNPMLNFESASATYFETLGVPIRRGRGIRADDDRPGAPPVVVVSERVAARTWPGADPIGRRVRLGGPDGEGPWFTVVGVAAETRYRDFLDPRPTFYVPPRPLGLQPGSLVLRVADGVRAERVLPALRAAVREVEPTAVVAAAASMRELMAVPLARPRLAALLLALFAGAALLLAAVGVYGVMAATVVHRTREIGVRLALGARAGDVARWVLARGLRLAAAGAAVGLALSLAGTRLLRSQLFGVSPTDPLTLAATLGALLAVAAVACWLPARRAMRVSPTETLKA